MEINEFLCKINERLALTKVSLFIKNFKEKKDKEKQKKKIRDLMRLLTGRRVGPH